MWFMKAAKAILGLIVVVVLGTFTEAMGQGLLDSLVPDWLRPQPVVVTAYSPVVTYSPVVATACAPVVQTCYYAPETRYRWV